MVTEAATQMRIEVAIRDEICYSYRYAWDQGRSLLSGIVGSKVWRDWKRVAEILRDSAMWGFGVDTARLGS